MNEAIVVSIISAVSGVAIAYIVNVAAKKVQKNKSDKQPKDRMEQMFDGYERLIKQKDLEDARKERLISELEEEISMTREMVRNLGAALALSQRELERSREDNKELKEMLQTMRDEYTRTKELEEKNKK